ncbi:SDR family NAD(P)-dependent oxidoreductase [Saccharopolyspora sp. NPDC000359]|uniref:SDR family NAD(P)-dependent oxidoreductase n=1 Tax=Saccharopolyspora sp. NPDC000359 TaxID=3154251 RepID=UPI0033333EDC
MELHGKTAVVTGGSRGIGQAIVQRLAADGAAVLFSYASDDTAAEDVSTRSARGHERNRPGGRPFRQRRRAEHPRHQRSGLTP